MPGPPPGGELALRQGNGAAVAPVEPLQLHADPAGVYPDPVPFGEPVRVTGQFNHPAAAACAKSHYVQDDVPTVDCRTVFAVTAIEPIEP